MKKLCIPLLSELLCLLLLAGCGAAPERTPAPVTERESTGTIAYVPLDDRPVNTDRVVYLAESLGYEVVMPEESLYHTCLDGQDPNPNGTQYGDRAALYEWVLAQNKAGCSRYILSLDQLLSGGLVNSRSFSGEAVTLYDGTVLSEFQLIDGLLSALANGENQVYLMDTVMRLAPTVGYNGWDLEGYETLRAYGMASRPALTGDSLTVENIAANYGSGPDGAPLNAGDFVLTAEQVAQYHRCRERKLRLIDHALSASAGMDNVHFLIGVDDSAPSDSIQTSEIAWLKQAVEGRGAVLSGADEDGMLAVCRLYGDTEYTGPAPKVRVRYFGSNGNITSSDYDHQPLRDIVDAHLDYLGAECVDGGEDVQVLVLTRPAEDTDKFRKTAIRDLIAALEENGKKGVPTVLMDAARNQYGTDFQQQLVKKTELSMLLGYAGFYDLANATGIALSNGLARWLCLRQQGTCSTAQNQAFIRTLADSLLKDICYKNRAKDQLTVYVREELGGNPDNFAASGTDTAAVLEKLASLMERETADVLKNLSQGQFLTSPDGERIGLDGLVLSEWATPWQRVFEIRIKIHVNDFVK